MAPSPFCLPNWSLISMRDLGIKDSINASIWSGAEEDLGLKVEQFTFPIVRGTLRDHLAALDRLEDILGDFDVS